MGRKKPRRKMTQREYMGFINSFAFRLSPLELKQHIELGIFPFHDRKEDDYSSDLFEDEEFDTEEYPDTPSSGDYDWDADPDEPPDYR
jgi:hypothetical protein